MPGPATTIPSGMQTSGFLAEMGGAALVDSDRADVGRLRERHRRGRVALLLTAPVLLVVLVLDGAFVGVGGGISSLVEAPIFPILTMFVLLIGFAVGYYAISGRSPHVLYQPDSIDVRLADVVGLAPVKDEVIRSLNLFLGHETFRAQMGGSPRRGLLFEGPPGTGKTYTAKAMAAEAGVPFLFATATSFQSSFYGATSRKIRAYFTALRKTARREGGAIGFIDEFDAIAGTRGGMEMVGSAQRVQNNLQRSHFGTSDLTGPVVNELLVQMQSFDTPMGSEKLHAAVVRIVNLVLPARHQLHGPRVQRANILVVASTNRADGLDPALLRPGRFDRRLTFDVPDKAGRREVFDHYLARKSHVVELDQDDQRDGLAAVTVGYSPVAIEHLLDEGLVNALRRGSTAMDRRDLEQARLTEEVGLANPVAYTPYEARLISTHEAGHATVAWLVAPHRRLEVLTMLKRRNALGMLAHGDTEDVFTRSRAELHQLVQIAFGGQVAEEIFFGDVSTGPAGDLAYATTVACQMVGSAGMLGSLVSFDAVDAGALSGTNLVGRVLADGETRPRVERLLEESNATVRGLIATHRHLVEALRDALLERHELVGREITDVLEAATARHAVDGIPSLAPPATGVGEAGPVEGAAVVDLREGAPGALLG